MLRGCRFFPPLVLTAPLLAMLACSGGGHSATDAGKQETAATRSAEGKETKPPDPTGTQNDQGPPKKFALKSSGFIHHGAIPARYTCDAEGVSPDLTWEDVADNVKSFVLIVDDPDAEQKNFLHWLVYNLPADARSLKEGVAAGASIAELPGAVQATNGFGKAGWGALCPPPGRPHRYVFRIYALDTVLDVPANATRQQVEDAFKGHFLGQAGIIASYARGGKG